MLVAMERFEANVKGYFLHVVNSLSELEPIYPVLAMQAPQVNNGKHKNIFDLLLPKGAAA